MADRAPRHDVYGRGAGDPSAATIWQREAAKYRFAARTRRDVGVARFHLVYWFACLAGLLLLARDCLKYEARNFEPPQSNQPLLAVHGEWTNRTRHLLARAGAQGLPQSALLLGRPREHSADLATLFARHTGICWQLAYPVSVTSYLRALPAIAWQLPKGAAPLRANGCASMRALTGIAYRVALGQVYREWWKRHGRPFDLALFGHSGTAESDALDTILQALGTRTAHLFHGVSEGINFDAGSTLAITHSAHDARWHEKLGGYAHAWCPVAPRPAARAPGNTILLLTNYAHPANPHFVEQGIGCEIAALEVVMRAAPDGQQVVYRPHPAITELSPSDRQAISREAAALGLLRWPEDDPIEHMADYGRLIMTPTTAMLDALRLGRVPILLDLFGTDPASMYNQLPWRAWDAGSLRSKLGEAVEGEGKALRLAWDRIGPGRMPTIEEIYRKALSIDLR